MTSTLELSARSRMTSDVARPVVPILIQVPNLTAPGRRPGPSRRRRRLRKEVRVAGLTMMSVLPAGLLLLALGGAHPAERPAPALVRAPIRAVAELARVSTLAPVDADVAPAASLDETTVAAAPVPVVFHDYLLPVDGPEEPDHAGR
jgi:hypothetical protein